MKKNQLLKELRFKAIRSSGAGGQHVNKVSSKVELSFDLNKSSCFSLVEKEHLQIKLASKLTKKNILIIFCNESRSQHKNKELVVRRFFKLIENNLKVDKKRKTTKTTKASLKKRAENKQRNSVKKALRKRPKID